jgi:hypothetical protein
MKLNAIDTFLLTSSTALLVSNNDQQYYFLKNINFTLKERVFLNTYN